MTSQVKTASTSSADHYRSTKSLQPSHNG